MSRERERLPWRHKPFPELVRLAWPIAVSTLSYGVMTLVDTLFVGRLGASALAGVGLGGVAAFTLLCFGFGLLRGVKILVSQAVGAGRDGSVGAWLTGGLLLAGALGVLALLAGRLVDLALPSIAASAEAAGHARAYLGVRLLGAPLVLAFVALREHRYGLGDTRAPMVASVLGNVVNVALDAVFILGLELGVAGAAWSTVAGHAVELAAMVWLRRGELRPARITAAQLRALIRTGFPTGLQFWLEVGSFAMLTAIVGGLGDLELASHQIALQVVHFSILPCVALGEACSVLAGQAVGAGELRLVRRVARHGLAAAAGYTGLATLLFLVGAPTLARGFTDDASLIASTARLLWIAALFQVADGAAVVGRGVLRGTGDVRFPAAVGIACAWLATPPLTWLLGRGAGLGAVGGWLGLFVEITVAAAIFWWRLERVGWVGVARASRARLASA